MSGVVQMNNVTKKYGKITAVKNVTLSIEKGSTVAILGPNGAGKTTTISMLLGLLEPSEGDITLFSKSPKDVKVRDRIGAMLQEVNMVDKLKVHEIIKLFRNYYSNPLSIEELISITGLKDEDLKKWADKLSGGQKRRLGFALSLVGNPDLVFFDEPTVGLDISARKLFWDRVEMLKSSGKTIIFSTHYLQEADDFSDRIILFNKGEIIADGKPEEVKKNIVRRSVSFQSTNPNALTYIKTLEQVVECFEKDNRIYAVTHDTDAVLTSIIQLNIGARDIAIEQGRLEEVFDHLTSEKQEVI